MKRKTLLTLMVGLLFVCVVSSTYVFAKAIPIEDPQYYSTEIAGYTPETQHVFTFNLKTSAVDPDVIWTESVELTVKEDLSPGSPGTSYVEHMLGSIVPFSDSSLAISYDQHYVVEVYEGGTLLHQKDFQVNTNSEQAQYARTAGSLRGGTGPGSGLDADTLDGLHLDEIIPGLDCWDTNPDGSPDTRAEIVSKLAGAGETIVINSSAGEAPDMVKFRIVDASGNAVLSVTAGGTVFIGEN